jgi:hypothetical protein
MFISLHVSVYLAIIRCFKIYLFILLLLHLARQPWMSLGLFDNQSTLFPRLVVRFLNNILFTGWGCLPHAQPPTWRARVPLLVWTLLFYLSGMGGPTSS